MRRSPSAPPAPRAPAALRDGAATTLTSRATSSAAPRSAVVRLPRPTPLERWCREQRRRRGDRRRLLHPPRRTPLGELRTSGIARPRASPSTRPGATCAPACTSSAAAWRIARRDELPADPPGDLLQAGPLLVRDGVPASTATRRASPPARASSTPTSPPAATRGRRSASSAGRLLAVACDGRADDEAGLTLAELAEALAALGAVQALNLDGGGSTSLVCGGRLRNVPREDHGVVLPGGRPVATAIAFRRSSAAHGTRRSIGYNRWVRVLSALMFFPRGGSAHVARALARELPAHGWDVTWSRDRAPASATPRTSTQGSTSTRCDFDRRRRADAPVLRGPRRRARPGLRRARRRRLRAPTSPPGRARWRTPAPRTRDVLHLHHLTPLHEAAARVAPDVPVVGHLHGTELLMLERDRRRPASEVARTPRRGRARMRRWARRCERLLLLSHSQLERARAPAGRRPAPAA